MFTCDQLDATTGEPCGLILNRRFNLLRHIERKHNNTKDKFIQYVTDGQGDLQKKTLRWGTTAGANRISLPLTISEPEPHQSSLNDHEARPAGSHTAIPLSSSTRTLPSFPLTTLQPQSSLDNHRAQAFARFSQSHPILTALSSTTDSTACSHLLPLQATNVPNNLTNIAPSGVNSGSPPANADSIAHPAETTQLPSIENTAGKNTPWEQRRDKIRKRLYETLEKDDYPVYQVKRSKKWPLQQRAVDWITQVGKLHFDRHFTALLAQWGVKETHTGTCILLPADWTALDPLRLASIFTTENCPLAWADGVGYQYADHSTSLTRAKAWFSDWPRNGLELDNFLGCGPYKKRQGSHLCHQHLCLIHLVFESAEDNEDRKGCHVRAKFLRQENLPVPHRCTKHSPPCLMQHAALTTFEAFLVQFFVLLIAKGLAALAEPVRPRWHPYSTFEYRLPLTFCQVDPAVNLAKEEIASEIILTSPEGKPELQCRFCSRIKAFKSIIALWSHYVHQHYRSSGDYTWSQVVVEEKYLLAEIRRTARLWRSYWQDSDGGRRRDPTMIKLNQVEEENFTWNTVLGWQLR